VNWNIEPRRNDSYTSECGRWVITRLYPECFELYDVQEYCVIGKYKTLEEAKRIAGEVV
jgi:hypothetical protein